MGVDWDRFDPDQYLHHYYDTPMCEDLMWVGYLADFVREVDASARAIEIGPGPTLLNLLLTSLCSSEIDVCERGAKNREHIATVLGSGYLPGLWAPYVSVITERLGAARVNFSDLRELAKKVRFTQSDNFLELRPPDPYDFVSMHFVAESATTSIVAFERATAAAVQLARPGGAFLFSFMARFVAGYDFGGESIFPSVSIEKDDVLRALEPVADKIELLFVPRIEPQDATGPYDGMIIAHGVRRRAVRSDG